MNRAVLEVNTPELRVTPELVLFYMGTPFCNFGQYPFRDNDMYLWATSEEYFMWKKALAHKDGCIADIIQRGYNDPSTAKALGRRLPNYDAEMWEGTRYGHMQDAIRLKFNNSPHLTKILLDTGDRTIAEASPIDNVWGIGLDVMDPLALEPKYWRGQNLLGKALMELRTEIRS